MFDAISLYKLAGLTACGMPETMSSGPVDSGPGGGIKDFAGAAAGLAGAYGRALGASMGAAGGVCADVGAAGGVCTDVGVVDDVCAIVSDTTAAQPKAATRPGLR